MKLYTINFNYNEPAPQKFTISTNTNFLIGVKAKRNGQPVEIDPTEAVLIAKNGNQTSADEVLTNGYVTFQMSTADTPYYTEYGLDVNGDEVKDFKIMLNVVKGDVGDVDSIGTGDVVYWDDIQNKPDVLTPSSSEITELDSTVSSLSESFGELDSTVSALALSVDDFDAKVDELDSTVSALSESFGELDSTVSGLVDSLSSYATTSAMESYVSTATSNFITESALTPYAKTSDVESTYATKTELSDYAKTSAMTSAISTATVDMATQTWVGQQGYLSQNDLSSYATTSSMESYVSTATSSFITDSALAPYATTSAMTSAISAATSDKVVGGAVGLAPVVSSAFAVYASVWATMSSSADANTLYVVLSDPS